MKKNKNKNLSKKTLIGAMIVLGIIILVSIFLQFAKNRIMEFSILEIDSENNNYSSDLDNIIIVRYKVVDTAEDRKYILDYNITTGKQILIPINQTSKNINNIK